MEKSEISREWREILARGYLDVEGIRFDVTHLRDAEYCFRIEATGRHPELRGVLVVGCGSHCISKGPKQEESLDFSIHGEDRRIIDENDVHRCFDETRYAHSLHLAAVFETFAERVCLFTGRRNWLTVEIIDDAEETQTYEIFFRIKRQSSHTLRIFVESAYVRDSHRSHTRPVPLTRRGKVSAKILMTKTLRGESIKRPIRRARGNL